jgi:hypothetical protein
LRHEVNKSANRYQVALFLQLFKYYARFLFSVS